MNAVVSIGYGQLLRQNGRFRRLWAAQLISAAGDWFNSVAVIGLVLQLTSSGLGASLVLICSTLPSFFLIPIAGPIVDRFDRRTLMIITNLFAAVIALLFVFVQNAALIWLLYVALILLIVSASFFIPASSASIPNIVSREELFAANALSGATWGIMVMVGSALGGIVSTLFGRDAAFVINAVSFLVAALLIATVDIPSPRRESESHPWHDFTEGLAYLRRHLSSLALVGVKTGWGLGAGSLVLISVFSTQIFKTGDAGIGQLYAARGLGALIGPFMIRPLVGDDTRKMRTVMWACFLLCGAGYVLFAISGWLNNIWLGSLALVIAHFGGGTNWAISGMLLQIATPDRLRGRVLAVDNGINTLTTGISTLVFGLALQAGVVPMWLGLAGGLIFVVYGVFWRLATARGPFKVSEQTVITNSG